ncbi:DUF2922 family protein [Cloacibacillus sp. An23]|uniref:DUF2922 family protein n=1 Tax=Cloacibacillus sp. An23 TaxID=1965591 RepID=UPI000B371853|nr:DUF2922 family protein [Cloacibacillus sp. An23]OUO93446.1 hypothetical protein B5F39_07015 [Cloacibacillus sp. An23]
MKTVKIKFVTDAGKSFYVSMDYAAPTLADPEGAAKVQAAVELILEQQPFAVVLASCESAELIDRTSTAIELTPTA